MRDTRRTLCVDFDGVIHAYSKGWQGGELYDGLTPNAAASLRQLSKHFKLVCCTARHNLDDVRVYLRDHGILGLFEDVTNRKPMAAAYIDDRAIKFDGDWDAVIYATQEL